MYYNSLAISLTNKCNASCKFCGVSACNSDIEEDNLQLDVLEKICKELVEIDSIKNIVFTGGEPFLYFDRIKSIIPLLKTPQKRVGAVTNGFIFKDKLSAGRMINEIRKNNFDFLHISTDQYHLEYINLNIIKNAIAVCKEYGLDLTLKIGINRLDQTYVRIIEALEEDVFNVSIKFYPIMPLGRAAYLEEKYFYFTPISDLDLSCKHSSTLFVDEKGDIYPCCFFKRPKSMILGNIKTSSIKEAAGLARKNKCYKEIYLNGLKNLVNNFIKNQAISITDNYVDSCHLCNEIFGNAKYQNLLYSYYSCKDK